MTASDLIALVGLFVVAVGWVVSSRLNRKDALAEKRHFHRLEALKSFLPVRNVIQCSGAPFEEEGFLELLETSRMQFSSTDNGMKLIILKIRAFL